MKKVIIICGGPSSEYEVSLSSTQSIIENIDYEKYDVSVCIIGRDRNCIIKEIKEAANISEIFSIKIPFFEALEKFKEYDVALLGTHGQFGEDGVLQTYLEDSGIKYTGSDSYSSRLAMDKYRSSLLVTNTLDISMPKTELVKLKYLKSEIEKAQLPIFIKPNRSGSSVCSYIIKDLSNIDDILKDFDKEHIDEDRILIQELIEDYVEVSCGCLEKKNGFFIELPPIEIIPQVGEFFDYKSKYEKRGSIERIPAIGIPKELRERISELALDIHQLIGCKLYSRSDFLIKEEEIYYLETNTLPGMTATSLIPQETEAIGINYTELISFYIDNT